MSTRKVPFVTGEIYHIYNRGIDKRDVFSCEQDLDRFFVYIDYFNDSKTVGSIRDKVYRGKASGKRRVNRNKNPLVEILTYCVHANHYHFLVQQISDNGISKFMQKLGTGYTMYFNTKYRRSGSLFQGKFKSVHVSSNEQLLHVSAYVNLNDRVHKIDKVHKKVKSRSSWNEYMGKSTIMNICSMNLILDQFSSRLEYQSFAEESLTIILGNKATQKETEFSSM